MDLSTVFIILLGISILLIAIILISKFSKENDYKKELEDNYSINDIKVVNAENKKKIKGQDNKGVKNKVDGGYGNNKSNLTSTDDLLTTNIALSNSMIMEDYLDHKDIYNYNDNSGSYSSYDNNGSSISSYSNDDNSSSYSSYDSGSSSSYSSDSSSSSSFD